jgi:uncharacterized protein YegP (UPF0339 family)
MARVAAGLARFEKARADARGEFRFRLKAGNGEIVAITSRIMT